MVLSGCASPVPSPGGGAVEASRQALGCPLPSNCVNSVDGAEPGPLRYAGTAAQAMAALQATLATFPEARVVRSETLLLEVIFTTPVGFRDRVEFIVDAQAQRIDFRSYSLFGLYDFGKNRSRMQAFRERFDARRAP